jgi:hypothetical protein
MLEDDKNHAVRFDAAHYFTPTAAAQGRVSLDFHVDREPNAGRYLVLEATERLSGDTDQVAASIESLATDHLREATGTSARIHDDGYSITIQADVPAAAGHARDETVRSPAATETGRSLTAPQSAALPELELAIRGVLPAHERHHTQTLALRIANNLPTQKEVVNAYYRPTLAEVLDHHGHRMDARIEGRIEGRDEPAVPSSLKTTHLSFPQHPSTALNHRPISTRPAATSYAIVPGERVDLEP